LRAGVASADKRSARSNGEANKLQFEDRPVHSWYRFVLSFPPHLVRDYLDQLGASEPDTVLDPFCGTGTVLVEARKRGLRCIGIESNPMAHFASQTKVNWSPDPDDLAGHAAKVARRAHQSLAATGVEDVSLLETNGAHALQTLPPEAAKLLLAGSISPLPLHKALLLRDAIAADEDPRYRAHEMLALANVLVQSAGNLHFGPEVGVTAPKKDAAVVDPWLASVRQIADDLRLLSTLPRIPAQVHLADSRGAGEVLEPSSVDIVITSPPYPNEKDYTRTTRLESVVLGFVDNMADLRTLKRRMVRSNTRGVYKGDDDHEWVESFPEIKEIAAEIERRRVELGKTSGFERMYARVTELYFGGMARHLAELRRALRPGARLAYVVGDQASYLQVMIETGRLLGEIAQSLGYELLGIDLFRTRLATATRQQLREEVVLLRWPG
jgi:DNA modification methylase